MDFHERLMTAMRSLDDLERDVRSCQTAVSARLSIGHDSPNSALEARRQEDAATANLQLVLGRRKELARLWAMGGDLDNTAEIQRLLNPLQLQDMNGWSYSRQETVASGQKPTPQEQPTPRKSLAATFRNKQSIGRVKKARQRESSSLQYTPAHISRIFDTKEAVTRATQNKIAVELEGDDDSDEEEEEEEAEGPVLRPLSAASTGSNITVYRPPTPTPDEVAQAARKATLRKHAGFPRRWSFPKRQDTSKKSDEPPSTVTISSRETVDVDRLNEIEDYPEATLEVFGSPPADAQQEFDRRPSQSPPRSTLPMEERYHPPDNAIVDMRIAGSTTSVSGQNRAIETTSELSFATSNGTGLFISDKKRPKKHPVTVVEGTILGQDSRIDASAPSPIAEKDLQAETGRDKKTSGKAPKKPRKRKNAADAPPGEPKKRKCSGGAIDVGDLVTAPRRRKRPSRATMKNGVGLLIGNGANDDAMKRNSLSWQSKGRGKGVTRAVPLAEMARKDAADDNE